MMQLRIGEVARLLGVTPKTIRHYHKLGLTPEPPRSEGDYRLYDATDLMNLQRIRQLQALGLSLGQIKLIIQDPNPDALLQQRLSALHSDIVAQQERLQFRRTRIEAFLAKGSRLLEVEQPQTPSPTYEMLTKLGPGTLDLPEPLADFDRNVFARLDSFHWNEDYHAYWRAIGASITGQPDLVLAIQIFSQKMLELADLPADPQRAEQAARDVIATGAAQTLKQLNLSLVEPEAPLPDVMKQIIDQSMTDLLSPCQAQFLQRIGELMATA